MSTGNIINLTVPFAKGLAMNVATRLIFPNGKTLVPAKEKVNLNGINDYLGVPALTELQLRYDGQIYLLNDCIMTVSQEKNIVTTVLQGRDGAVKEYISDGDFSINVQASIAGDYLLSTQQGYETTDAYPVSEMNLFMTLLKAKAAIEVTSEWLNLFGIKSVVIKSYDFEQETYSNDQSFSMQMLSDEPFEIKSSKNA